MSLDLSRACSGTGDDAGADPYKKSTVTQPVKKKCVAVAVITQLMKQ